MSKLTRIVAAVVDTKKATLYKADGNTVEIMQGDLRLRPLLEKIAPDLRKQGWSEVDLSTENSWKQFEESTNGAVRLFRIAKDKLASLFGSKKEATPVPGGVMGTLPSNMGAVLDEIMAHATPVTSENFSEEKVAVQRPTAESGETPNDRATDGVDTHFAKSEDTIVAITPKGNIVPGVERIKSQFTSAAKTGNTVGMTRFLERLGAVIKDRTHTVEDLLRFMERGDLPVADDGTIIIYKKLYRSGDHYVDPHTRRVTQRVGSYVHMDHSLVDKNRRNECSNGLHVARRGYIRSFSGDVVVLAKVRPEDVIAVPDYDANKMRVCGYHIVKELTPAQYQAINNNRPISDAEGGLELLAQVLAGDHIGITEMVKINGQNGTKLEITKLVDADEAAAMEQSDAAVEAAAAEGESVVDEEVAAEPAEEKPVVKVRVTKKAKKASRKAAVAKVVAATKKTETLEAEVAKRDSSINVKDVQALKHGEKASLDKKEAAPVLTQTDVVKAMWEAALAGNTSKAQELLKYKKAAKKGWHVWGLPSTATDTLKALL